jgi:multidrug efflux system outer membrane protein
VLSELICSALEENKDVKIAAARVENFLGQYGSTRAALFPQIGYGANAGRHRTSEVSGASPQLRELAGSDSTYDNFQTSLSAGWEIDLWGKLRRATEAARANLLSTEEARRSVILTLVASVATSYVQLRDLDKRLDVTRRTVASYQAAYDIFKLRLDHGFTSELEVAQAKSQLESARANIPFFEKAIAQQENALSELLGRNPGPIARGKTIDELTPPAVPTGLPSEVIANRPDIRQTEQRLIAANANIGVAKAQYFPSISLTGLFGYASSDLSDLFTDPGKAWSYTGSLTGPIFTAGAIAGRVKSAEAEQRESLFRYQQAIQTAFREVNDALVDQQRTKEELANRSDQVNALRDYLTQAQSRYDEGYGEYLDVIYAENQLYNAELAYVGTQGTLFQSLVNLYKAMGRGWEAGEGRAAHPVNVSAVSSVSFLP